VAAAAPVFVAICSLLIGLDVRPVTDWFWPAPTTNIVEAAAMGDAARVRALAARGEPLNRPMAVRPGILPVEAPSAMSALEAAVWHRGDETVAMIVDLGARPTVSEAQRLSCLATAFEQPAIAELLLTALAVPARPCDDRPRD
jgi:hypothetical protein